MHERMVCYGDQDIGESEPKQGERAIQVPFQLGSLYDSARQLVVD